MMGLRIGVDLGGTKIEGLALDPSGREVARKRVPTPREDYAATLAAVTGLVAEIESKLKEKASVGIGMPGALSRVTGLVKNSNSTCLNGRPFQQDVEKTLGLGVRIENDANSVSVSWATDGGGNGAAAVSAGVAGPGLRG